MSLASETRRAVDERPFLVTALRAGVVNYTQAARFLDVDGDTDAVATALRRYAADLPAYGTDARDVRVTMRSGVGVVDDPGAGEPTVAVGGTAFANRDDGDYTAIVATGDVDATGLGAVLRRLDVEGIDAVSAGVAADRLTVVVDRLDGANALRTVEAALAAVPEGPE